ncbi:MAG: hypothetical protein IID38_07220 [Planctomycetes bacterium]|nr:hypothetical protein [Planctomycetota bacterium]
MLNFQAPYFHRKTNRVVFQMTNATPMIDWFHENFPVATVLLLRHPIPNALSIMQAGWRQECADFLNHRWFVEVQLTGEQVDFARRVVERGSLLAQHVLDWSLKMLIPLRALRSERYPEWLTITYEQLVLQPEELLQVLSRRLDLPDGAAMRDQLLRPSRTVSSETEGKIKDQDYLLRRWRKQINPAEEKELMKIPKMFGLDVYEPGRLIAADPYLAKDVPRPRL